MRLPESGSIYKSYIFGGSYPLTDFCPGAKFTLRPNLAFSYIGSVTARHSTTGRQPNFVAFSRVRHLYSTGGPLRWASAHILVKRNFQHANNAAFVLLYKALVQSHLEF